MQDGLLPFSASVVKTQTGLRLLGAECDSVSISTWRSASGQNESKGLPVRPVGAEAASTTPSKKGFSSEPVLIGQAVSLLASLEEPKRAIGEHILQQGSVACAPCARRGIYNAVHFHGWIRVEGSHSTLYMLHVAGRCRNGSKDLAQQLLPSRGRRPQAKTPMSAIDRVRLQTSGFPTNLLQIRYNFPAKGLGLAKLTTNNEFTVMMAQ